MATHMERKQSRVARAAASARNTGLSRTTRTPSRTSCKTACRSLAGAGAGSGARIQVSESTDTRKEAASTSSASGAVRA